MMTCPRDTDGDGNCGSRHCPFCGLARQHRLEDLTEHLARGLHQSLYQRSAIFKTQVEMLADMTLTYLDAIATKSVDAETAMLQAIEQARRAFPRIVIDPSLPPGTMRLIAEGEDLDGLGYDEVAFRQERENNWAPMEGGE